MKKRAVRLLSEESKTEVVEEFESVIPLPAQPVNS